MKPAAPAAVLLLLVLLAAGCRPAGPATSAAPAGSAGRFTVMTFNLNQYALADRDGNADTLEPKPPREAAAVIAAIRQAAPDILALQEMGDPAAWADFQARLRAAGLDYPHTEYLRQDPQDRNLALLSRFPIAACRFHTNDTFTIGPGEFPVRRGFIEADIDVNPGYRLHLLVAHLKSKVFHEYGQAEMRRNEARLLANHVRAVLKENPDANLLVVGDLNDNPDSDPVRSLLEYQDKPLLFDLRPEDADRDAWTYREGADTHYRIDYLLASPGLLPEVDFDRTCVLADPGLAQASDHRPLLGTFCAADRGPEAAPDLAARKPCAFPPDE